MLAASSSLSLYLILYYLLVAKRVLGLVANSYRQLEVVNQRHSFAAFLQADLASLKLIRILIAKLIEIVDLIQISLYTKKTLLEHVFYSE